MTRPALACPRCGAEDLIPAHGRTRGRYLWRDAIEPVECACGALVTTSVDDMDEADAQVRAVEVTR